MPYAGNLVGVYYRTQSSPYTKIDAKVEAAEGLSPENFEQAYTETVGKAGENWNPTVTLVGQADFALIDGYSDDQTERFWAFEFDDGYYFETTEQCMCMVSQNPKASVENGNLTWDLKISLKKKKSMSSLQTGSVPTS